MSLADVLHLMHNRHEYYIQHGTQTAQLAMAASDSRLVLPILAVFPVVGAEQVNDILH